MPTMKDLDSLSKQIEQYESHLKMVKADISAESTKRDTLKIEIEKLSKDRDSVKKDLAKQMDEFNANTKEISRKLDSEREDIASKRHELNTSHTMFQTQSGDLEMERRKLALDRARVDGFISQITQVTKSW